MVDYSEILMQSMDVLVSKRLSDLQFDKTIICTIVDASNAEKGEYEVTDGATTFTAYSKDVTFKEEDSVYITIPNGDYGNQKLIVGKHVGQGESLTYISPLDTFINITGDLCNFTSTASLLANSMTTIEKEVEKEIKTLQVPNRKTIWKGTVSNGKGFERLCIKADFRTWLKKLKVNEGNYGLCLFVSYVDKATANAQDSVKIAQYILDSNDMYGNPYNFESFYTQSKTFNITNITGQITNLELVFYQDANFSTTTGEAAPTIDSSTGNTLMDNIFVQNISIGFGYDITKFTEDTVMIYCLNEPTYNLNNLTQENRKTLNLRWIRSTNEGIYSVDSEDEIPENAEIHWYKYQLKVQDEVDELAGPLWFEIEEGRNKLTLEVDPDVGEYTQQYKAIIEVPSRQWITNQLDEEMNIDYKLLKINAEGKSEDSEEVKLLSQYEFNIESQRKIYESDPIEFKSEVPVFDKMTADLINGLQIVVDENGYKGNYLLYNLSNQIQNPNEASKMRIMRATYKSLVTGEQTLDGAESIIWKIPLVNSMIYPPEDGKEYNSSDVATSYWAESGYAYIKRLSGKSAAVSDPETPGTVNDWSAEQKFRIKDYYQESATNNTVYCYVVKNNVAYEASQELTFGPMGTNGTDFTFRMSFESDIPGVTRGKSSVLKINLSMYDFNNEKVPNFWNNGVSISWYHPDDNGALSFCDIEGKALSGAPVIDADKCFYVKYDSTKGIPHAAILQAQVTVDPTVAAGTKVLNAVKLTCYLPIPYRDNDKLCGIEGATKILYDSSGTKADYYKEKYRLWENEGLERKEVTDITWTIYSPEYEKNGVVTVTEKYYENGVEKTRTIQKNSKPNYFPKLTKANTIIVPSMYTELDGDEDRNIYVTATTKDETVLWSQPIMMTKDAFSSTMLNSWDGSLTIDENNGTILSTMIGAGKKDSENRFEGVLMGDVKCAIDDITKAGLYGFSQGVQSFGWMIDGTGFIGKSGQGQIRFDGNRGTISSGIWKQTNGKIGMEIDLDGPTDKDNWSSTGSTMYMFGAAGKVSINTSKTSTKLFVIEGRNNLKGANGAVINDPAEFKYDKMLCISVDTDEAHVPEGTDEVSANTSFYLQSLGYQPTKKGTIAAHGTRLDLQNGNFYSFGKYGRIQFAVNENTFFRLADAENKVLFVIKGTATSDGADGDGGKDAIAQVSQYYLQSSNFDSTTTKDNSGNVTKWPTGTRLDLQNGKFTSYGKCGRVEIATSTTTFFRLADATNHVLFVIKSSARNDTDGESAELTGDSGQTSAYYLQSSNFNPNAKDSSGNSKPTGTRLDLQNGKFTTYGSNGYVIINSSTSSLFKVYGYNNTTKKYKPLMVVGSSYYLQTLDYVPESGTTAGAGTKIDLAQGRITSYKFTIKAVNAEKGQIVINSDSSSKPLQIIGNNSDATKNAEFTVEWDGSVTCTKLTATVGGTIGPFKIDSTSFTYGSGGWGGATVYLGTSGFSLHGSNFKVDASSGETWIAGKLHVTGTGDIAGITISSDSLSASGSGGGSYSFNKNGKLKATEAEFSKCVVNDYLQFGDDQCVDKTGNFGYAWYSFDTSTVVQSINAIHYHYWNLAGKVGEWLAGADAQVVNYVYFTEDDITTCTALTKATRHWVNRTVHYVGLDPVEEEDATTESTGSTSTGKHPGVSGYSVEVSID